MNKFDIQFMVDELKVDGTLIFNESDVTINTYKTTYVIKYCNIQEYYYKDNGFIIVTESKEYVIITNDVENIKNILDNKLNSEKEIIIDGEKKGKHKSKKQIFIAIAILSIFMIIGITALLYFLFISNRLPYTGTWRGTNSKYGYELVLRDDYTCTFTFLSKESKCKYDVEKDNSLVVHLLYDEGYDTLYYKFNDDYSEIIATEDLIYKKVSKDINYSETHPDKFQKHSLGLVYGKKYTLLETKIGDKPYITFYLDKSCSVDFSMLNKTVERTDEKNYYISYSNGDSCTYTINGNTISVKSDSVYYIEGIISHFPDNGKKEYVSFQYGYIMKGIKFHYYSDSNQIYVSNGEWNTKYDFAEGTYLVRFVKDNN